MKWRRFCCCLLVCVCFLSGQFLVSASALEVDGHHVFTNYYDTETGDYIEFTNTLVSDTAPNELTMLVDVHLSTEIEKDVPFNIDVGFTSSTTGSFAIESILLYDSSWSLLDTQYGGTISNGSIKAVDLQGSGNVKYVRFVVKVTSPTWKVVNTGPELISFTIDGISYQAESGMTLGGWAESDYNTGGFYVSNYGFVMSASGYHLSDPSQGNATPVSTDVIPEGNAYGIIYSSSGGANDWGGEEGPSASYGLTRSASQSVEYHYDFAIISLTVTEDDEQGIISGILAWIKSIYNGIMNLPQNLANSLRGFFDNIVNALSALGDKLLDGIKALFVPSEEDFTQMQEKFENLLADRFGLVYQSVQIIDDFVHALVDNATTDSAVTMDFPKVTVPLAGTDFSFGGWTVTIIPEKFMFMISHLHMITNIIATILFVNGLRKRLTSVIGG